MAKLFLGIRIPNRTYQRVQLENVCFDQSVSQLREEVSKKIEFPREDIELLYCGNILEDGEKMIDLNIAPNTTVHVLKKTVKLPPYVPTTTYTDSDCQNIASIFMEVTGAQINVQSRMNILQKILDEYPEFRRNLGAQALIRDSVLFNSLDKFKVIRKVAETYPIVCEAAAFIVKTIKRELTKSYQENSASTLSAEELFSDLTSGSEEESSAQSNSEQARIRRISRDQLAAALNQIGSASSNSLSNIAQRNVSVTTDNASTSTASPSSATSSSPIRISSNLLNSALRNALLSATAGGQSQDQESVSTVPRGENAENQSARSGSDPPVMMDTSETQQATSELSNAFQRNMFANELQIMHEVGLMDDTMNIQALNLARGEVEEAINFVYMWST